MMFLKRTLSFAILGLLLAVSALQAGPRLLAHSRSAGENSAYSIVMESKVPTQGDFLATTALRELAASVEGDGFHAQTISP